MKLKAKDLLMREFIVHNCENFNDYTETSGMLAMRKYDLTPDEVRDEIENIKGLHKPGTFLDEDELDMLFRNEYKNEQSTSLDDFIMNASMDSINRIGEYGIPYHYAQHTLQYIDERMEGETAKSFVNHFIEVGATGFDDYIETTGYFEEFVSRADMNVIEKIGKRGIDYDFAQATLDHLRDTMGFQTAREVAHACIMTGASNYREFEERASAFAGKSWNTTVQQVCTMFDDMREYQQLRDEYETVQGLIQKRTRGAEDLVTFRNHIIDKIYKLDDYYQFSDAFEERDFVAAVNETSKYTVNETPKQNLFHKVVSMWQNI